MHFRGSKDWHPNHAQNHLRLTQKGRVGQVSVMTVSKVSVMLSLLPDLACFHPGVVLAPAVWEDSGEEATGQRYLYKYMQF